MLGLTDIFNAVVSQGMGLGWFIVSSRGSPGPPFIDGQRLQGQNPYDALTSIGAPSPWVNPGTA